MLNLSASCEASVKTSDGTAFSSLAHPRPRPRSNTTPPRLDEDVRCNLELCGVASDFDLTYLCVAIGATGPSDQGNWRIGEVVERVA